MKRVAVLQSNYIPWRGYFDLIAAVDEFVVYDDAQYTTNDWRNRNIIKTREGPLWLTVPVRRAGRFGQTIREAEIDGDAWRAKHWRSITQAYARAPFIDELRRVLGPIYEGPGCRMLWELNRDLTRAINEYLGIRTVMATTAGLSLPHDRNAKLVEICRRAGATTYVSGPAARAYLDAGAFTAADIAVEWFDYQGLAEYPQQWGPFEPRVSVIDLLANCGPGSGRHMRYVPAR